MRRALHTGAAAAALAAAAATAMAQPAAGGPVTEPRAAAPSPAVSQLVVFKSGKALQRRVRARAATVRVSGRRCAVASGTPLAALVRSRPGRIGLRDFGSCSRRARDGGQLFVRSIRGDRNRGQDGWIYKVGRRLPDAGAGDPAGPFGRGRLRSGQRVTWFYGRKQGASFQRTLELKATVSGETVSVLVRGYDDNGRGVAVPGAAVSSGAGSAQTGANGRATLELPPGRHLFHASKPGFIRSFGERVVVR